MNNELPKKEIKILILFCNNNKNKIDKDKFIFNSTADEHWVQVSLSILILSVYRNQQWDLFYRSYGPNLFPVFKVARVLIVARNWFAFPLA